MRIVFMGTPSFAVPTLEALIDKYEVVMVVTQPDKPLGRKMILTPSPVKEVALKHNIPVFQPEKIKENYRPVLDARPDIIITAAYGQFIPTELLETPCYKAINVHASLLPKYRGGAPIQKAILNGDEEAGVSIMYMSLKMDEGDIILQDRLLIGNDNTTKLTERLSIVGKDLLLKTLLMLPNLPRLKQDPSLVSYAPNISKADEKIDWNKRGQEIVNQIRALALTPGAYTLYGGRKIKIYDAQFDNTFFEGVNGEMVILNNKVVGIKVIDGIIYPSVIQTEGKKAMNIKDFLNGARDFFTINKKFE